MTHWPRTGLRSMSLLVSASTTTLPVWRSGCFYTLPKSVGPVQVDPQVRPYMDIRSMRARPLYKTRYLNDTTIAAIAVRRHVRGQRAIAAIGAIVQAIFVTLRLSRETTRHSASKRLSRIPVASLFARELRRALVWSIVDNASLQAPRIGELRQVPFCTRLFHVAYCMYDNR
jgi:hypothetical protein